jgi:acyl carrier protein
MTTDAIKARLVEFLARAFEQRTLGEDEDIFGRGFGNSLFAMQLVEYIEGTFRIEIDSDDLEIEHFRSINCIVALVTSKLAAARAA